MEHRNRNFAPPGRAAWQPWLSLALALVTVCLAAARTRGLTSRGLLEHDEGHALLNANTWRHVMRWAVEGGLWNGGGDSIARLRDVLHQQGGTLYSAGKLGYSLLVAAVALPGHVSTNLALALAWVAGLLVALFSGVLAWRYTKAWVSVWLAVLGCVLSPLLFVLSREASGTIWAVVCGLAGACLIDWSVENHFSANISKNRPGRKSRLAGNLAGVAGGMLLGFGFTCHFNLAPFIIAVFVASAWRAWQFSGSSTARANSLLQKHSRFSPLKEILLSLLPMTFGAAGFLLAFEAFTQTVDYVLRNAYPEFLPFSGELKRLFFRDQVPMLDGVLYGDGAIGWGRDAWMIYVRAILREGSGWFLLLMMSGVFWCGGLLKANRRRRSNATPALLLMIIPACFWAAYVYRVERVLGMCIAASWVFIGVTVGQRLTVYERGYRRSEPIRQRRLFILMFLCVTFVRVISDAYGFWEKVAEDHSPVPAVVRRTFEDPRARGLLVNAGSFDTGFAPIWKWAIVEYERGQAHVPTEKPAGERTGPRVDFSRFDRPGIVFIDPSAWRRPTDDFHVTPEQASAGQVLVEIRSHHPSWDVKSVLLPRGE